jgi:hypothetical protein
MHKATLSTLRPIVVLLAFLAPRAAAASTLTDFQARLKLTSLCLGQSELQLRALPHSSVSVSASEVVASWQALVLENVAGLAQTASNGGPTDDQKKVMADGLNAIANVLRDHAALARNRGLEAVAFSLTALEATCRSAVGRL